MEDVSLRPSVFVVSGDGSWRGKTSVLVVVAELLVEFGRPLLPVWMMMAVLVLRCFTNMHVSER